jgi:hypothetical protein
MANFEQRKSTGPSSKGTSSSSAPDMYNWYSLLRPRAIIKMKMFLRFVQLMIKEKKRQYLIANLQ